MGVVKKFNRKEKEFRAGKMLAIKDLTKHLYRQVMKGRIIMLTKEIEDKLKENNRDFILDFDVLEYTLVHLGEGLLQHEEFFEKLSTLVYTDGEDDDVHISKEAFNDFSNYVMNNIGMNEIYPIVSKYDKNIDKVESVIEGNRIMTSVLTGKRHEVSTEEGDL